MDNLEKKFGCAIYGIMAGDKAQIEEIKRIWGIEGAMRGIPRCTV